MSAASDALREFHEAFGVEAPESVKYGVEYDLLAEQRRTLHEEEHVEVNEALEALGEFGGAIKANIDVGARATKPVAHLARVAEELADEVIVAYGTADLLGIDLDVAFAIKHAANMAKLPDCELCDGRGWLYGPGPPQPTCTACNGTGKGEPIKREDGKVLKPEGWQAPDMSAAIR